MSEIKLTKMQRGQVGTVLRLEGGQQAAHRLEAMGLRIGKNIKKISGVIWGPVTVQVGHTHVGIGRGMASKVIVEIEE